MQDFSKTAKALYCSSFEAYKSNVCHLLHNLGDIEFIKTILIDGTIPQFAEHEYIAETLYLLAMLDYVSKENDIPICTDYNSLRCLKLTHPALPSSARIARMFNNQKLLDSLYENAIPEFLKYNIVEGDVRNVN